MMHNNSWKLIFLVIWGQIPFEILIKITTSWFSSQFYYFSASLYISLNVLRYIFLSILKKCDCVYCKAVSFGVQIIIGNLPQYLVLMFLVPSIFKSNATWSDLWWQFGVVGANKKKDVFVHSNHMVLKSLKISVGLSVEGTIIFHSSPWKSSSCTKPEDDFTMFHVYKVEWKYAVANLDGSNLEQSQHPRTMHS